MVRDYLGGSDGFGGRDELLHSRNDQRMLPVRKRIA
jgi:hypothetical protein